MYSWTCGQLAARLRDPSVRILDVRWPVGNGLAGRVQYDRARIPRAEYLALPRTEQSRSPAMGTPAGPEALAVALRERGVQSTSTVVVYDDNHQFTAARLVWLLRAYGFHNAYRLDGGWPAWVQACAPVESQAPVRRRHHGASHALRLSQHGANANVADLNDVLTQQTGGLPLFDCRRDSSWTEHSALIPGARRLPVRLLLDRQGLHQSADYVRAVAAELGAQPYAPVITYCAATISASAVWLALRSAGFADVRVYAGSLAEYLAAGYTTVPEAPAYAKTGELHG